ncbi:hypothetical protein [Methylobacterium bullatum]
MKDASRNDPELLARRAESQARIEVERQEQNRLIAEDEARRASETVRFPDMSLAMACDMIEAYARYKGANRSSTPAEIESLSRTVHGLDPYPGQAPVRLVSGLPMPLPASGVRAVAVETVTPSADPAALDNVLQKPSRAKKPASSPELESGVFLIEDDDD